MKKLLACISVFIFAFLIIGCSCKKEDEKVSLQIGNINSTTYKMISLDELKNKIDNDESFLLYIYSPTCMGCQRFKPILESVIDERNLIVYAVQFKTIESYEALSSKIEYTPSLVIYNEGEFFKMIDPDESEDYFSDKTGLESFLDKYTHMPTMYYLTLEQLRNKKSNKESFIVYFSSSSCSDCSYLNRKYLKEYLNDNYNTKKFYILETDEEGIKYKNNEYDEDQWCGIKDEFGLSEAGNTVYGYGVGYVPTIQYYEKGEIKDMLVYFNDIFETNDNYVTVTISDSYYSDNPFLNTSMKYSEYKNKLEGFYNEKVKTFLDKNLVLVD